MQFKRSSDQRMVIFWIGVSIGALLGCIVATLFIGQWVF